MPITNAEAQRRMRNRTKTRIARYVTALRKIETMSKGAVRHIARTALENTHD